MRANAHDPLAKIITRNVEKELERRMPEIFKQHADDLIPQATATFLWTMATRFGWGEKRLRELAEAIHDTEWLMDNPSRLHHKFTPYDCEREIKKKYGIDIRAEFPVKVEDEKGRVLNAQR